MESRMEWLNFVEKLYFTIAIMFYRYNSDNNKNLAYINCLWRRIWCLIDKKDITPYT